MLLWIQRDLAGKRLGSPFAPRVTYLDQITPVLRLGRPNYREAQKFLTDRSLNPDVGSVDAAQAAHVPRGSE